MKLKIAEINHSLRNIQQMIFTHSNEMGKVAEELRHLLINNGVKEYKDRYGTVYKLKVVPPLVWL